MHGPSTLGYAIYHFIRDEIKWGHVIIKWVPSEEQLADILTKPLPVALFNKIRAQVFKQPGIMGGC